MSEQVKFYRGNYQKFNEHFGEVDESTGEIIFVNDAMDKDDGDERVGSIYQDKYIVGTTRADELRLTNDLVVVGGPLADDVQNGWPEDWKDSQGNPIIPKGQSMEDILRSLFTKRVVGEATWNTPVWNPYIAKPVINSSYGSTLEVGSLASFTYSKDSTVYDNTRTCSLKAPYGYFEEPDGVWCPGGNDVCEQRVRGTQEGDLVTSLEWTSRGQTTKINSLDNFVIYEGENKLKVGFSGIVAHVPGFSTKTVYPSTNTREFVSTPVELIDEDSHTTPLESYSQVSITGRYKYFIGSYDDVAFDEKQYTSQSIREDDIITSGWVYGTTVDEVVKLKPQTKAMYIAIPRDIDADDTSLRVKQVSITADVSGELIQNKREVSVNCGSSVKNYKVYTWSFPGGITGEEIFEITSF